MAPSPPSLARRGVVVVFAAGDASEVVAPERAAGAFVIAADSGVELAQALGWPVDLAVGDFDSVDPAALATAEAGGATVERHPSAKDATDLELALEAAIARDPTEIVVVGGAGGRLDHLLGGLLVLAAEPFEGVPVRAHLGAARVHVVRSHTELIGRPGQLVTLLAAHGPAEGVTTDGLLYPLRGETLHPGSTRGVSNEMTATVASVDVTAGVLLAVLPDELGTHHLAPDHLRPPIATGDPS